MSNLIIGTPKRYEENIILQTCEGNDILNSQILKIEKSLAFQHEVEELRKNYPDIEERTAPSGIYNCHGLTFACRRTGIDDSNELRKILHDDCYKEVSMENALPGDIVLYEDDTGDISHSGIVVEAKRGQIISPRIVSKWGDLSEMIHGVYQCPYPLKRIKYFRCRL